MAGGPIGPAGIRHSLEPVIKDGHLRFSKPRVNLFNEGLSVFMSDHDKLKRRVASTGVSFLDRIMGGQLVPGVHCLLGPTGSGKTTLGAMIAAEGALRQARLAESGQPAGRWIFINLQMHAIEVRTLVVSHLAKIDREVLGTASSTDAFSTSNNLRPYETRRLGELSRHDGNTGGERERYRDAVAIVEKHLEVVSMEPYQFTQSLSPVACIRHHLDGQPTDDRPVRGIVIDCADLAVDYFMKSPGGIGPDEKLFIVEAKLLVQLVEDCHRLLGSANQ